MCRVLRGEQEPSLSRLGKIADVLDVTESHLLDLAAATRGRVQQSIVGNRAITTGGDIGNVTAVDATAPGGLVIGHVAGDVVQGTPDEDEGDAQ